MRATCVLNDPKLLADHQQDRSTPWESTYPITVGKEYPIVGMSIIETSFFFLVRADNGGPLFVHAGFFDLFTAEIPSDWRFALEPGINASGRDLWSHPGVATWGYPELVEDPYHMDRLYEFDPEALAVFNRNCEAAGCEG